MAGSSSAQSADIKTRSLFKSARSSYILLNPSLLQSLAHFNLHGKTLQNLSHPPQGHCQCGQIGCLTSAKLHCETWNARNVNLKTNYGKLSARNIGGARCIRSTYLRRQRLQVKNHENYPNYIQLSRWIFRGVQFQDANTSRAGKLQALECHCNEQPRQTPQLAKGSQDLMDLLNGKNWDMMIWWHMIDADDIDSYRRRCWIYGWFHRLI